MKKILMISLLAAVVQLEANALRVSNNSIIYEVDLSAHTAEVIDGSESPDPVP